jgi:hypothetical protein
MERKMIRQWGLAVMVCSVLAVCAAESEAVLANDECSGAIEVLVDSTFNGTTIGATGYSVSSCGYLDMIDVWHKFTPTSSGVFVVSLCGSDFDTTLLILDGCSGTAVACNDDGCVSFQSELSVSMTGGEVYYIRIAGYNGTIGNYSLIVSEASSGPVHDECIDAIEVFEDTPYADTSVGATGSSSSSCVGNDTADVWHKFIPDATGLYSASLCGSSFDTTVAWHESCGGSEIACNDDFCDLQSQVNAALTQGMVELQAVIR